MRIKRFLLAGVLSAGWLCGAQVSPAASSAFSYLGWDLGVEVNGEIHAGRLLAGRADFSFRESPAYAFFLPSFLDDTVGGFDAHFLTGAGEFTLSLGSGEVRMEWFDVYADPRNPSQLWQITDPLSDFPVFIGPPSSVWVGRFFEGNLPSELVAALEMGSARVEIWSGGMSTGLGGEILLVPEPSTWALLLTGGIALGFLRRR